MTYRDIELFIRDQRIKAKSFGCGVILCSMSRAALMKIIDGSFAGWSKTGTHLSIGDPGSGRIYFYGWSFEIIDSPEIFVRVAATSLPESIIFPQDAG